MVVITVRMSELEIVTTSVARCSRDGPGGAPLDGLRHKSGTEGAAARGPQSQPRRGGPTTSTFTNDAKAESTRDGAPPVDLVDGAALCDLLVQHRLGVVVRERIELDVQVDQAALDAI